MNQHENAQALRKHQPGGTTNSKLGTGSVQAQLRQYCLGTAVPLPPSRVRLVLRAQLISIRKQTISTTRNFQVIETADSDDAYGGVVAANHATAKLVTELAQWLETIAKT